MKLMQEENMNLELKASQEETERLSFENEQPTVAFSSQDFARMQGVVDEVNQNEESELGFENEQSTVTFSSQDFARMQGVVDEVNQNEESEVELSPEPEEVVTVKSLHQKAWPKATVVGGCLFLVFGIFASMVGGTLNTINSPPSKTKPTPDAAIATDEDGEIGELKTKNFLTSQSQELSSLNKRRVKAKLKAIKPIPSPILTDSRPARPVERIVEVNHPAPRSVFTPTPAPRPISVAPSPLPQVTPSRANTPDPLEQWKLIANVGKSGRTSAVSSSQPTESSDSTASSSNSQVATRTPETRAQSSLSSTTNRDDELTARSHQTLRRDDPRLLVVGTKVAGELETPIAWSGSLKKPNQKFILQLKDSLKAADNSIIIPKGAKLIAQITRSDEAGLVQMTAVSVMLDQVNEKPLPENAILILGRKGQPLQAKITNINNVGKDVNAAFLKGIAKAADLVNQATSESTFSSRGEGFIRTSSTNRRRNYPASFLNGLAESMSEQTQSRTQQAISNMQSQPHVFALNQGTEIQVFVNQSFSF